MDKCPLEMDGIFTYENTIFFPLGYYDVLIGMDQFKVHKVNLDFYNKTSERIDKETNPRIVKGTLNIVSIRNFFILPAKMFFQGKMPIVYNQCIVYNR